MGSKPILNPTDFHYVDQKYIHISYFVFNSEKDIQVEQ